MAMAMSIYRTLCVLVFESGGWEDDDVGGENGDDKNYKNDDDDHWSIGQAPTFTPLLSG